MRTTAGRIGRGWRALIVLALVSVQLVASGILATPASAGTVTVQYDPADPHGVDPCLPSPPMIVCAGGVNQMPLALNIVQAAASQWMDMIEDPHDLTIKVSWKHPDQGTNPEAEVLETDDDGRVAEGRVRFPPHLVYFFDPTPDLDEEFLGRRTDSSQRLASGMMRPKLYRTLHPDEQSEAFLNTGHEVLEVGYNGLEREPPGTSEIHTDLLTFALHEVGHLMGLTDPVQSCATDVVPSGYVPPVSLTGGAAVGIKGYQYTDDEGDPRLDCNHLAAGGITTCKPFPGNQAATSPDPSTRPGLSIHDCTSHQALFWQGAYPGGRQRPSVTDVLAIADAEGWQDVDLPRKYSLGAGGAWLSDGTWLGDRIPDSGDDVYIVNQEGPDAVTNVGVAGNAAARNLYVSDENKLQLTSGTLAVGRTVWVAGPHSTEGPVRPILPPSGGVATPTEPPTVDVGRAFLFGDALGVEPGGRVRLLSGSAQFGDVMNSGLIQGQGTLGVARSLTNGTEQPEDAAGAIKAEGGLLRIVTPEAGGFTTDPPEVDLDGESPLDAPTPPRVWAVDGNLEIDAMVEDGFWADLRIGSGRTLRFARDGIQQNATSNPNYALRFQGGATGATLDAPSSSFAGTVEADGIGRFTGRTRFYGGAHVRLDIGGTTPGSQYDQLQVQDVADLGGTLQLSLSNGFVPQAGQSFPVLTYESHVGEFADLDLPPLPPGRIWSVEYGATELRLRVVHGGPPADFDGDGDTDRAVFRPATGTWFIQNGTTTNFGTNGDIPVPGDYDGDGNGDQAVFRPANGYWFVGNAITQFGTNGDIPVPGDYDGDGDTDRAVFRPGTGTWFVHGGTTIPFGTNGDVPVPGDYDGDGDDDVAVFRPGTGTWFVHGGATIPFGTNGDIPVPGDYDGDGDTEIAVFRPASGTWFVHGGATIPFGTNGDIPVPGDYDGDGDTEIAVFRPASGTWFVIGGPTTVFGTTGDVPLSLPTGTHRLFFP